ncbi:MAG: WxL domain-containing protein, partial [Vagococcus sp.]|uniref:WxL domain-containing protein n=1 Tax=Vagococcus sp. TaxID=1933889 RepID=UPI002FC6E60C
TTEPVLDLENKLEELSDEKKDVPINYSLDTILKPYIDKEYIGYDFSKRIVKVDNKEVSTNVVPKSNFIVELHYNGKLTVSAPENIYFGKHKLTKGNVDGIRPEKVLAKESSTDYEKPIVSVVDTQGKGGKWALKVSEKKKMHLEKDEKEFFKGYLYYVDKKGSRTAIDNTSQSIELNDANQVGKDRIYSTVPLVPNKSEGLFITASFGNKSGNYINGEILWNLEDAY